MPRIKHFLYVFIIFGIVLQSTFAVAKAYKAQTNIHVTNATVYVPLGSSQSTIAFFTMQNDSKEDLVITQVTSPAIKKIELILALASTTSHTNPWLIPKGKTVVLAPQKQYLQLNGLINSLTTGDELHLEVRFNTGAILLVTTHAKSAFDQPHNH